MRNKKIITFYNKKQVCFQNISDKSYSQSPLKPYLFMKHIREKGYAESIEVESNFKPFEKEDFLKAHTKKYVDNVWAGRGNHESNGLPWSRNLVESLTYTNASLYNAIRTALTSPENVTFAPISGMHHAQPNSGGGFCTFSGQVISSVKLYEEFGAVGAYFDLDGHFGNSIEDSRSYVKKLNKAIPIGCNINPRGKNKSYNKDFDDALTRIGYDILRGRIHYVVFAHGADSHVDDDLGSQCDTESWLKNATIFANWVNEVSLFMGKPLPVTLALFGGYRKDNYEAVLNLHLKSLLKISNIICGNSFKDNLIIPEKILPEIKYKRNSASVSWKANYIENKNKKRMQLFGTL